MKKTDERMMLEICQARIKEFDSIWDSLERVWEEDDKQYNNQLDEGSYVGAANIKVPATYDAVETLVAFGVNALYQKGIPVRARGVEGGDAQKVKLYNRANEIKQNKMNPVMRQRVSMAYRRFHKFGIAAVKIPYDAGLLGADFIPLRPEELRFDPFVPSQQELDFYDHKVRRTLKQLKKMYGDKIDAKRLEGDDDNKKESAGNSQNVYRHTKTTLKLGDATVSSNIPYYDVHECWFLAKSSDDKDERWYLATVVADYMLRCEPAPYDPPFVVQGLVHQEGTTLGLSTPRIMREHQKALNDYHNQTLDCGTIALQPMYSVDELSNIAQSQLKFRPNGVVYSSMPSGVQPIKRELRPDIGMQMQGNMENAIARLTGATPSLMDVLAKNVAATESRRAFNAATNRALEQLRLFVDNIMIPWHKRDFQYTRKFVPYEKFMRMVGKDAALVGEAQLTTYFNEDYDSIAEGFMDIVDKMAHLQMAQNYLNILTKMPMNADLPTLARDYGEWLGFEDPDRYIHMPPPPTLMHPLDENKLLLMGERVPVNPRDPHAMHLKDHKKLEVPPEGAPEHDDLMARADDHVGQHMRALRGAMGQAALPPQEMPQMQPSGMQEAEAVGQTGNVPTTV